MNSSTMQHFVIVTAFVLLASCQLLQLDDSVELGPSLGAASSAATQLLPSVLWNPKVHYRVQKSPPYVPILSQINPLRTTPSYLSTIYLNIINPPASWSS
jgi:hypothetical protein